MRITLEKDSDLNMCFASIGTRVYKKVTQSSAKRLESIIFKQQQVKVIKLKNYTALQANLNNA